MIFFSGDISSQRCRVIVPQSIKELKDAIRQEIASIPHEMIRRVIDNFRERLRQCVDNNGSHLSNLIFKTK